MFSYLTFRNVFLVHENSN